MGKERVMSTWGIIVNPTAGGGKCQKKSSLLVKKLRRENVNFIIKYTKYKGHACVLAKKYIDKGINKIMIVGGDGTVNEIIRTVKDEPIILGILPMGTGNDFARSLGISMNWKKALQKILKEQIKFVDLGYINGVPFTNIAGLGFDVEVLKHCLNIKKVIGGIGAYLIALINSLANFRKYNIIIENQNVKNKICANIIAIGNGTHYAGGINITPLARMNDGLFDVCIIHDMKIQNFLKLLPRIIAGKHINSPYVQYYKTQKLYINTTIPLDVQLDGELLCKTPIEAFVEKRKLRICL